MTPEKLKDWNLIAIHGATHEVEEMARTAVPELIAEVERLQRKNEELQQIVDDDRAIFQERY